MTREEYRKRLPFIDAWLNGEEISYIPTEKASESLKRCVKRIGVEPLSTKYSAKDFMIQDEYCNLRLGVLSGKTLLISNEENSWEEVDCDQICIRHWNFNNKPLADFKFKVGDWVKNGIYVRHKKSGKAVVCEKNLQENLWGTFLEFHWLELNTFIELYEQWFPVKGELCYMWNPLGGLPAIRKYDYTNVKGMFFDTQQKGFKNCIPYLGDEFWIDKNK